ncbi:hypothetical protein H5410_035949 [Solanum commersonii]|uniref:Retrovirus-related Pol polyprotein from transposon TNT 1-94-like beta-barrel domain-containing protein n=1 Tax=Solanum commersonii TaxID=4109 RepID=A0A9J5Y3B8_SOLCO|nr:hypothetical protein H5410_035949 [Solanum commersonii]
MERCFNCGKKGHYPETADTKQLNTSYVVEESNQQEKLVTYHSNKEDELALATISEKLIDYEHNCIVHSGCSNHVTGDEEKLINMSEYKGGRVVVTANNSRMSITHIDKIDKTVVCKIF